MALNVGNVYCSTLRADYLNISQNVSSVGNITCNGIITSNIFGSSLTGSLDLKGDVEFQSNVTLIESKTVNGNLNVSGYVTSDNLYTSISYYASVLNYSGARRNVYFHTTAFGSFASVPLDMKIYGLEIAASSESETYTGNLDVEVYTSQSTTPIFHESYMNGDSRWTITPNRLDGSMIATYGRNLIYLFPTSVVVPSGTIMQVIYEGTNSFTGSGLELSIRLFTRTCN